MNELKLKLITEFSDPATTPERREVIEKTLELMKEPAAAPAGDPGTAAFKQNFGGDASKPNGTQIDKSNPAKPATPAAPITAKPTDPVQALKDALTAIALDPANFQIAAQQQVVQYPGGSYVLKQVRVFFVPPTNPEGRTLYMDADELLKNPATSALDVKWVFEHPTLS